MPLETQQRVWWKWINARFVCGLYVNSEYVHNYVFSSLMWGPTLLSQGINSFCKLPHSLQYLFTFYVSYEPPNTKHTCTFWWMLVIVSTEIVSQLIKILRPIHNFGFKTSGHYIKTYGHVLPLRSRLVRFFESSVKAFSSQTASDMTSNECKTCFLAAIRGQNL